MNHYVAIAGSNRAGSNNKKLVKYLKHRYAKIADISIMSIADLPVFYKTADHSVPERVREMAQEIAKADGVIIATPEYDHGVPAVLMNALEWLSYTVHPFKDKPIMILGVSFGTLGTLRAQEKLRKMLDAPELGARQMPNAELLIGHAADVFDDQGQLKDPELVQSLDCLFADFETFVDFNRNLEYHHADALKRIQDLEQD